MKYWCVSVTKGDAYEMSKKLRGRAIIINNNYFLHQESRGGSERDVEELKRLFEGLHFTVAKHEDLEAAVSVICQVFFKA
jgi:hypothetical protein